MSDKIDMSFYKNRVADIIRKTQESAAPEGAPATQREEASRDTQPEKIDYAAKDRQRGQELLTAFISWVNADHEDSIVISRESGCYIRDEIERFRKAEARVRKAEVALREVSCTYPVLRAAKENHSIPLDLRAAYDSCAPDGQHDVAGVKAWYVRGLIERIASLEARVREMNEESAKVCDQFVEAYSFWEPFPGGHVHSDDEQRAAALFAHGRFKAAAKLIRALATGETGVKG